MGRGGVEIYSSLGIGVPVRDGNLTLFRVSMHFQQHTYFQPVLGSKIVGT